MRILTQFARPGLALARPVVTADGLPLLGRGTRLTRGHLRALSESGVRIIAVEDDPELNRWDEIPEVDPWLRALAARFAGVAHDRRMATLRDAVRVVYLDFLAEIEGSACSS